MKSEELIDDLGLGHKLWKNDWLDELNIDKKLFIPPKTNAIVKNTWNPIEWSYNPGKVENIQLKQQNVDFENFRIYVGEDMFFVLKNKLKILNFGEVDEINWEDNKNEYCLGLKVMYILSYLGGMSMENLKSENKLAKSLAHFYFYYHLKKFYNYRNFLQYDVKPLKQVELFKSLYHWNKHKVHFYKHMKMGDDEFKKNKHDVIANVRKVGNWITWEERGNKRNINEDYKKLILTMGKGLTKTGQLLFQESCQAYVYCVLGSQAKSHWKIIGDGANSLQTQNIFLTLVDEVIAENNLSILIKSMRLAIKQTKVRLDFCVSPGLELIPSEMIYIKDNPGYNNVLLISNNNFKFGINSNVNREKRRVEMNTTDVSGPKTTDVSRPKTTDVSRPKTTDVSRPKTTENKPKTTHILTTSLITVLVLRFFWLAL